MMTLSEAILLGSTLKPQTFRALRRKVFYRLTGRVEERTCGWGAALDAFGVLPSGEPACYFHLVDLLPRRVQQQALRQVPYPDGHYGDHESVFRVIMFLNDECRWTRERIAEWVATVEGPLGPEPAPVTDKESGVCDVSLVAR
jgi:hypothetical protein